MKRLSWTELLLLPLGICGLTTCWLALWVRWLMAAAGHAGEPSVSPLAMLVILAASAFITRWSLAGSSNNLQLQRPQVVISAAGLAAVGGLLWWTFGARFPADYFHRFTEWGRLMSPEALALAVGVLLWWQGIRIGRDDDLHTTARGELWLGVSALAILFIVNKIDPRLTTAEGFWPTVLFFVIGLSTLAVAGLEQDRRIQATSGPALGVSRDWLGTVGALIGAIVAGAVGVAALVTPETLTAVNSLLDLVGVIILDGFGFLVYLMALLLLPVTEVIVRGLIPFLRLLTSFNFPLNLGLSAPSPEDIDRAARQLAGTPPARLIEVALVLGVILLIFMAAVRRLRRPAGGDGPEETHESVFSRDLVWRQLRSLFAGRAAKPPAAPPYFPLDGPVDPRLSIRRAYQQLLAWAAAAGQPRHPPQTPHDYARTLGVRAPALGDDIRQLTELYVRARYGGQVSPADAGLADAALGRLLSSGGLAEHS